MTEIAGGERLHWALLLPLLATLPYILLLLVRRAPHRSIVIGLGCGAPAAAFLICFVELLRLLELPPTERIIIQKFFTWISAGDFTAPMGLLFDPLSSTIALVITLTASIVHLYAAGALSRDENPARLFAYLNLLVASLLVLVLSDNLLLAFLGFQGAGLCAYLLVGFQNLRAPAPAFVSRLSALGRLADAAFLLGLFLLVTALADQGLGAIVFFELAADFPALADKAVAFFPGLHAPLGELVGFCFVTAAFAKGIQLPLLAWRGARAATLPAIALLHALAPAITGIYLLCRFSFVYQAAPAALGLLAWLGALTALVAAVAATLQGTPHKMLGYSTLAQLGLMFLGVGVGAAQGAVLYLVTHAFCQTLLFLSVGSVFRVLRARQSLMPGRPALARAMPRIHLCFAIGVLASTSIPWLSAYYAVNKILFEVSQAQQHPAYLWLYGSALLSTGITAFYLGRLYLRIFHADVAPEEEAAPAPNSPADAGTRPPSAAQLGALYAAAAAAAAAGLAGPSASLNPFPVEPAHSNSLANYLTPVLGAPGHALVSAPEIGMAALTTVIAVLGLVMALRLHLLKFEPERAVAQYLGKPLQRIAGLRLAPDAALAALPLAALPAWAKRPLPAALHFLRLPSGLADYGRALYPWTGPDSGAASPTDVAAHPWRTLRQRALLPAPVSAALDWLSRAALPTAGARSRRGRKDTTGLFFWVVIGALAVAGWLAA